LSSPLLNAGEPSRTRTSVAGSPMPAAAEASPPGSSANQAPLQKPWLSRPITTKQAVLWSAGAVTCFHLAYSSAVLNYFILAYLFCLLQLSRLPTTRQSFYLGLVTGLLGAAPQLECVWAIFQTGAIALWLVVAFWTGLFVALAQICLKRFGMHRAVLLLPILWTGLEYFRSELYYLRFSWLNVGYAFAGGPLSVLFHWFGMYGIGFLAMSAVVAASTLRPRSALFFVFRLALVTIIALFFVAYFKFNQTKATNRPISISGVQLEFPTDAEVLQNLDKVLIANPAADLFVLSEYTFDGPVPEKVKAWCRTHHRYLVVGGKDPAPKANFYDTAFVIDPDGDIVFRQVKSVPIQFFKDGLPATEQKLWDSPWGKIGLCVCYDLSYTRVIDRLIRLGAQVLIVPTMDVVDWGMHQHQLHARVAPVRGAEYGLPIFRLASSGISQAVDGNGKVMAQAGVPGQGQILSANLVPATAGSLPVDRWLGPICSGATALLLAWFCCARAFGRKRGVT
jgi:apolipoprotein N-acyltransferase